MNDKLVTPPAAEPVTVAELKEQLRLDHGDEDALLAAKITAARRHIENLSGLTLATATFDGFLDRFPAAEIALSRAPVVSVESVNYLDLEGLEQQASNYELDLVSPRGWIVPVEGFSWPQTMKRIHAVRVRFVAGYAPQDVPQGLKEAILQLAAWWYEQREAAAEKPPSAVPFGVQELVAEHREWTF